ncbi:Wzz/FepE/Etk N-terminal domain-containing protein [Bacillus sp. JJ1503]|uniref:Wzz/FepE/Etk N-terminal domain-containing protein n=1 Tax=Bacillus sp. JJ1503 TaxID=3122956 RepID=UPI002FFF070F
MQDEISLRELIETILNGKWIIATITAIAVLIAVIASYFIIQPSYETSAKVLVNSVKQENAGSELATYLNEAISPQVFSERLQSSQLLKRVIEKEGLKNWTVKGLRTSLTIETKPDTNIVTLTLKGKDPIVIQKTLTAVLEESKVYIGEKVSERLNSLAVQYNDQLTIEKENLDEALKEYNQLRAAEGLPSIVLLDAVTSTEKQYTLQISDEQLAELHTLNKNKQVQFEKINNKVKTLTNLYNKYSDQYEEARSIAKLYKADSKLSILAEADIPSDPVSPKKALNLAIALVLGLMVGVGVVFLRYYWKNSAV